MKRGRKRFTLIELLTVVVVVTLLVAMMMPALSAARERARAVECMGNLKQIGVAYFIYVDDYNGVVPQNKDVGPSDDPDVPAGQGIPEGMNALQYLDQEYIGETRIFVCPTPNPVGNDLKALTPSPDNPHKSLATYYGINGHFENHGYNAFGWVSRQDGELHSLSSFKKVRFEAK